MTSTSKFKTTEAFISGGICGHLWMPAVMAGKPMRHALRGPWGIMDGFTEPVSFREALDHLLMREGGDFQDSAFTADTRITIIRKRSVGNGRYELHVWERELSQLRDCADLVHADAETCDFMGDGDD